jgi:hypothetical protein
MSEFLKKLQDALEKGEKNEEVKQFMDDIDKKADNVENPEEAVKERLKNAGERELTEEEKELQKELKNLSPEEAMERVEEFNKIAMVEVEEEDKKWANLAHISNMKTELRTLESDFEALKEKYEKNIADISDSITALEKEFIEKYGEDDIKLLGDKEIE